ncbi:MAG: ATP-dependent metallopeptidase FtsH/Yme1/Tma family protein, partial [Gammaproteobacteria bacterium]|nr:ATP-dependent metallopeptidase FtsH/Yme1/Tma family protein [Gammaproteobacteria bacterium]
MNNLTKNLLLWLVIAIVLMSVFNNFGSRQQAARPMEYSTFIQKVRQNDVDRVTIQGREIIGKLKNNESFTTYSPGDPGMIGDLIDHGVSFEAKPQEEQSLLLTIFINWFPLLLLVGVWVFFMRQMQGGMGGRGAMSFGKSKARMLSEEQNKITFDDVAGVEEAKEEVGELVEF